MGSVAADTRRTTRRCLVVVIAASPTQAWSRGVFKSVSPIFGSGVVAARDDRIKKREETKRAKTEGSMTLFCRSPREQDDKGYTATPY